MFFFLTQGFDTNCWENLDILIPRLSYIQKLSQEFSKSNKKSMMDIKSLGLKKCCFAYDLDAPKSNPMNVDLGDQQLFRSIALFSRFRHLGWWNPLKELVAMTLLYKKVNGKTANP